MKRFSIIIILALVPLFIFGQRFNIGEQTVNYFDTLRNRSIKVEIWYPTNDIDSLHERNTDLPFCSAFNYKKCKITRQILAAYIVIARNRWKQI